MLRCARQGNYCDKKPGEEGGFPRRNSYIFLTPVLLPDTTITVQLRKGFIKAINILHNLIDEMISNIRLPIPRTSDDLIILDVVLHPAN